MKRIIYKDLKNWKSQKKKKPIVLMGARQVGKTYLLKEFGTNEYDDVHFFDFQEKPRLSEIFRNDLDPERILEELAIQSKQDINPKTDLIVFDEVQECEQALSSLKYFYDK